MISLEYNNIPNTDIYLGMHVSIYAFVAIITYSLITYIIQVVIVVIICHSRSHKQQHHGDRYTSTHKHKVSTMKCNC